MHIVLDIVLILVFVVVALIGYLRGFARSVWKGVTLVISAFLAYQFGDSLGKKLFLSLWAKAREGEDLPELLSGLCGSILIFAGSVLILSVVGIFITKLARSKVFSTLDSVLGLVLGIVCGLILVWFSCVIISFLIELNLSGEKTAALEQIAEESVIFRFFCDFSPFDYIHIKSLF